MMAMLLIVSFVLIFSPSLGDFVYENPEEVQLVSSGHNAFARDLYLDITNGTNGNIFFSPFSIATCFGMVHMGSQGNTETEIRSTFHYPADKLAIRKGYKDLMSEFSSETANYTLKSSNKIYVHQNFGLLDSFSNSITNDFLSTSETVNFGNSEPVRQKINSDVETETNSKIKDLIPTGVLTSLTRLVLVNAIYFKGSWETQFLANQTQDKPFWVTNEESVNVPTMNATRVLQFKSRYDLDAKILKLLYKGGECSFIVVLPNSRNGLSELESKLHNVNFESLDDGLVESKVHVELPKFSLEEKLDLKENLIRLGLIDAFIGAANFSGISGKNDLYISDAFHKAFLEVNEEGAEAGAATSVIFSIRSFRSWLEESFVADHPFLFFIKHENSNSILFAGRFVRPN